MNKIIPILIVSILVLGGLGAVAKSNEDTKSDRIYVDFSSPTISEEQDCFKIEIDEANLYLMKPNQPMLPKYARDFIYSLGTEIESVNVIPKNIETEQLTKEILTTPEMQVAGKVALVNTYETESDLYPADWFDYSIHSGLYQNERSVIVHVEIYPVKYNSKDSSIEYVDDFEIEIKYKEPEPEIRKTDEEYEFVIISDDYFDYSLDRLVAHKNYRDVSTISVSVSDIYYGSYFDTNGRDEAEQIKYFIKDAIENWGTKYVMLVGRDVPNRETHVEVSYEDSEIFVSDLYYADIYDGKGEFCSWDSNEDDLFAEVNWYESLNDKLDLYPDVHIGRLACEDAEEVENIVNKIIDYEEYYAYDSEWFRKIVVGGGDSFPGDANEVLEGEIVNEHILNIMDDFEQRKVWVSNEKLTTKGPLNDRLNSGCGFVDLSGHGNEYTWCTHPHSFEPIWVPLPLGYINTDVMALDNGEKLPIVITGACSVGKYNNHENCFSWSWLKNEDGGGIASFGAAALGYAYMGEYVTYGLVERMTIETFSAYKSGAYTIGQMWSMAIESYLQSIGLESEADYKTILEWHCFGDPTLAIAEPPNSDPPNKPERPEGPTQGDAGVDYTYSTSTTDPEGDEIFYLFDWGDGTNSGWQGPFYSGESCYIDHSYDSSGQFWIKVKAKDTYGVQGQWSDPLGVEMPRTKNLQFPLLQQLLEKFFSAFPMLHFLT